MLRSHHYHTMMRISYGNERVTHTFYLGNAADDAFVMFINPTAEFRKSIAVNCPVGLMLGISGPCH